jgi:hypothetical protein
MFDGLAPHVIEQGVGHIQLADLDCAHGDDTDENKGFHLRPKRGKFGEESHGQKGHEGPEKDFKEGEHIPLGHDPVLEYESPGLGQLIL